MLQHGDLRENLCMQTYYQSLNNFLIESFYFINLHISLKIRFNYVNFFKTVTKMYDKCYQVKIFDINVNLI